MAIISSSCLIAVASPSGTILNKCGKSRYSCLVNDLRGTVFDLSQLSMTLVVWSLQIPFVKKCVSIIYLKKLLSTPSFQGVMRSACWIFPMCFLVIL
jgi:hypothetical protein